MLYTENIVSTGCTICGGVWYLVYTHCHTDSHCPVAVIGTYKAYTTMLQITVVFPVTQNKFKKPRLIA